MAKYITLAPTYGENRGMTHKLILTYADVVLLTSGTAYSIRPNSARALVAAASADTNPAGWLVKQCFARVTTAFASPGNTITLVAIVGDGGDTARFLASTTLKTVAFWQPTLKTPYLFTVADTVDITITAGVEAITVLNAGEAEFYFEQFDPVALLNPRTTLG